MSQKPSLAARVVLDEFKKKHQEHIKPIRRLLTLNEPLLKELLLKQRVYKSFG